MKGSPGLIAVILDEQSRASLQAIAVHTNVFCEHVTIAYRPSPDVMNKYSDLFNRELTFSVEYVCEDSKGQAVIVDGVPSEKKVPHVTISTAKGVPPSYSNSLLENAPYRPVEHKLVLRGVVKYKHL